MLLHTKNVTSAAHAQWAMAMNQGADRNPFAGVVRGARVDDDDDGGSHVTVSLAGNLGVN